MGSGHFGGGHGTLAVGVAFSDLTVVAPSLPCIASTRSAADCPVNTGGDEQHDPHDGQPQQCLDGKADDDKRKPDDKQYDDQTHGGEPLLQDNVT